MDYKPLYEINIAQAYGVHMTPKTQTLLRDIDLFLMLTDMKPTNFGINAINDPGLIGKLRKGRKLWSETEQRIRDYMYDFAGSGS